MNVQSLLQIASTADRIKKLYRERDLTELDEAINAIDDLARAVGDLAVEMHNIGLDVEKLKEERSQ